MAQRSNVFTPVMTVKGRVWLQVGVIAAAVFAIYAPVLHGDWLWDDNIDITDNAITQSPTGLWNIWFEPGSQLDYYPIKASVQWVQWHLWGMDTFGYHLTNVLLHIIGSLLVWGLFSKLGLKFAWLGGLLFAIHPANVESVAWIAELKNTLSLPPFLLAMIAWIDYDKNGKQSDYFLSLACFLIAMLCKTTMVMFPFVILLYAWWKRGRITWNSVRVSGPFFAVSLVFGVVTLVCGNWFVQEYHKTVPLSWNGGVLNRLALAGFSVSFYFFKCLWPVGLLPIYPQYSFDSLSPLQFVPWLAMAGVAWGCWVKKHTWGRHALLGLGFFYVMLSPFLGFRMMSYMDFTWVMDHFLYIPMIGLIGLVMAGAEIFDAKLPRSSHLFTLSMVGIFFILLGFGSWSYATNFINQESLWTYTVRSNPSAWMAQCNLGSALLKKGKVDEAIMQYQKALDLNANYPDAHCNLGIALSKKGQMDAAMAQFQKTLEIDPNSVGAHNNLGGVLVQKGQLDEAMMQYQKALEINPNAVDVRNNIASVFLKKGRADEAIVQYRKILEIDPNIAEAHTNLGSAFFQKGQIDEAVIQYQKALEINSNTAEAHNNLGNALLQKGQVDEAMAQYREALKINPRYDDAHYDLGNGFIQKGQVDAAMVEYQKALEINPNHVEAHNNLGNALLLKGQANGPFRSSRKP